MARWARLVHFGIAATMVGFFGSMVWLASDIPYGNWTLVAILSSFVLPWVVAGVGVALARPWARGFALGLALIAAPASIAMLVGGVTTAPVFFGAAQASVALLFLPGVRGERGHWRLSWSTAVLGILAPSSVGLAILGYACLASEMPLTGVAAALGSVGLVMAIVGLARDRVWGLFSALCAVVMVLASAGFHQLESAFSDGGAFVGAGALGVLVLVGVAPWIGPIVRHLRAS